MSPCSGRSQVRHQERAAQPEGWSADEMQSAVAAKRQDPARVRSVVRSVAQAATAAAMLRNQEVGRALHVRQGPALRLVGWQLATVSAAALCHAVGEQDGS